MPRDPCSYEVLQPSDIMDGTGNGPGRVHHRPQQGALRLSGLTGLGVSLSTTPSVRILEIGMQLTNQYILSIKIGMILSYYSRF